MDLVLFLLHLTGNELAPNRLFLVSDFNKTPTHRRSVLLQDNLPFLAYGEAIPDGWSQQLESVWVLCPYEGKPISDQLLRESRFFWSQCAKSRGTIVTWRRVRSKEGQRRRARLPCIAAEEHHPILRPVTDDGRIVARRIGLVISVGPCTKPFAWICTSQYWPLSQKSMSMEATISTWMYSHNIDSKFRLLPQLVFVPQTQSPKMGTPEG